MYSRVKYRGQGGPIKKFCARSCSARSSFIEIDEEPKPFEEIPGPRSLPLIGTLYKYLPFGKSDVLVRSKRK